MAVRDVRDYFTIAQALGITRPCGKSPNDTPHCWLRGPALGYAIWNIMPLSTYWISSPLVLTAATYHR